MSVRRQPTTHRHLVGQRGPMIPCIASVAPVQAQRRSATQPNSLGFARKPLPVTDNRATYPVPTIWHQ